MNRVEAETVVVNKGKYSIHIRGNSEVTINFIIIFYFILIYFLSLAWILFILSRIEPRTRYALKDS